MGFEGLLPFAPIFWNIHKHTLTRSPCSWPSPSREMGDAVLKSPHSLGSVYRTSHSLYSRKPNPARTANLANKFAIYLRVLRLRPDSRAQNFYGILPVSPLLIILEFRFVGKVGVSCWSRGREMSRGASPEDQSPLFLIRVTAPEIVIN